MPCFKAISMPFFKAISPSWTFVYWVPIFKIGPLLWKVFLHSLPHFQHLIPQSGLLRFLLHSQVSQDTVWQSKYSSMPWPLAWSQEEGVSSACLKHPAVLHQCFALPPWPFFKAMPFSRHCPFSRLKKATQRSLGQKARFQGDQLLLPLFVAWPFEKKAV